MNNTNKLLFNHPHLAPRLGVSVPDTWDNAIADALGQIVALEEKTGLKVTIHQIKEKFGGLRLYAQINDESRALALQGVVGAIGSIRLQSGAGPGTPSEALRAIVDQAQAAVSTLCAQCGAEGAALRNPFGWIMRLCPAHSQGAATIEGTGK